MKRITLLILFVFSLTANAQWIPLTTGTTQQLNSISFINSQTGYAAGVSGTIIKTTNGGTTWTALTSGVSVELKSIFAVNTNDVYACGTGGTIIKSTNAGTSWTSLTSGVTSNLNGIYFMNMNGICCGSGTIIYTTNGGANWLIGQDGILVTYNAAFMLNNNYGWVAGVNTIFSPLVGRTTNGGANWAFSSFLINNNEGTVRDIAFKDSLNGITVSITWEGLGGLSRTTNGGLNWDLHLMVPQPLSAVDILYNIGYAAGNSGYILKTTDGGVNWEPQLSVPPIYLRSIDITDSLTGYAAGDDGIILKTTNGGLTGIKPVNNHIPTEYKLEQNYPNPFNPSTKIKFSIPAAEQKGITKLIIYNSLGQLVETLVDTELQPGNYEVIWQSDKFSAGAYYYKLISNGFIQTKKMILLK
jgi:photosystem II stability/assembly factor-like uncharacterized protein